MNAPAVPTKYEITITSPDGTTKTETWHDPMPGDRLEHMMMMGYTIGGIVPLEWGECPELLPPSERAGFI